MVCATLREQMKTRTIDCKTAVETDNVKELVKKGLLPMHKLVLKPLLQTCAPDDMIRGWITIYYVFHYRRILRLKSFHTHLG